MATLAGDDVDVLAVAFDPPDALVALAADLARPVTVLADPGRRLYARLGMRRAPWWRVWSPGTLRFYARTAGVAAPPGPHDAAPVDTRQMGGDAVVVGGVAVRRWLPRTPVDRVSPATPVAHARSHGR